jgi:hypothetical protein
MTSKEVFQEICSKYFVVEFSDDNSDAEDIPNDRQNWIKCGTEQDFLNHVYIHSNYEGSFPVIGITTSGKFKHRNFKKHVSREIPYKYRISSSHQEVDDNIPELIHDGNVTNSSNALLLNMWRGSGSILPVYNLDLGPIPIPYESSIELGMLVKKKYANISFDKVPSLLPPVFDSDNTYSDFYISKIRNLTGVSMYSSENVEFSFKGTSVPLEVLDVVMIIEGSGLRRDNVSESIEDTDSVVSGGSTNPSSALEDLSGLYIVTKITKIFTLGFCKTLVEACREFHPNQIGSLLGYVEDEGI